MSIFAFMMAPALKQEVKVNPPVFKWRWWYSDDRLDIRPVLWSLRNHPEEWEITRQLFLVLGYVSFAGHTGDQQQTRLTNSSQRTLSDPAKFAPQIPKVLASSQTSTQSLNNCSTKKESESGT